MTEGRTMGMSAHERAIGEVVRDRFAAGGPLAGLILETVTRLNAGHYAREWVDTVIQKRQPYYDAPDAWAWLLFVRDYWSGALAHFQVRAGAGPSADRMTGANQGKLGRLPGPFAARFRGGPGDSDGEFSWNRPVVACRCFDPRDGSDPTVTRIRVDPRALPLEVGTTLGSCSLCHIARDGGLARWPYGSEWVTVYVRVGDGS